LARLEASGCFVPAQSRLVAAPVPDEWAAEAAARLETVVAPVVAAEMTTLER